MKADRSVCKSKQSSADVTWRKMTQSSANKRQGESSSVEMLSMYTKKRSGPRIDPCGTPDGTLFQSEQEYSLFAVGQEPSDPPQELEAHGFPHDQA